MQQNCIELYRADARENDLSIRSSILIRSSPLYIMCLLCWKNAGRWRQSRVIPVGSSWQ